MIMKLQLEDAAGRCIPTRKGDAVADINNDEREVVREMFNRDEEIPEDVIPGSGMTADDYLLQNARAGRWTQGRRPARVITDADGMPIGIAPAQPLINYVAPTVVSVAELDKVGLRPEDVPNLRVIGEVDHD